MNYKSNYLGLVVFILFFLGYSEDNKAQSENNLTWTYTYIKAKENRKVELKEILIKNWLAMDSIAVIQGLFKSYELIENLETTNNTEWDFIVAVEYFTRNTYSDIAKKFEEIRKSHKIINVNGFSFKETGQVIKSELVKKSK